MPRTQIAPFAGITPYAAGDVGTATMALISVERATQVLRVRADGRREIAWEEDYFESFGDSGTQWSLIPVDPSPDGRFIVADGSWATGGYQAVLTRSTIDHAPGAPTVVAVHNSSPYTGCKRW
ncbi:hypothetical protein [Nocardia sp. SYP-A9097]|uniref:hypothetical protein n=1 Tax=Nocardia sp. SYP-A9097 TaxID=2663237 RepID=UPI00129A54D6|nr:hypothetical protein [Nocardia sp. SYP-A9097]